MVYTRGTPADYDNWAALGHPEWSYEKVLPYFVKSEKTLNQPKSAARGDSGPWINQSFRFNTWLYKACQVSVAVIFTILSPITKIFLAFIQQQKPSASLLS